LPPLLDGRLPGAPTTRREFGAGENVVLVVEVYDNAAAGAQAPAVRLDTELRAADGTLIALTPGVEATTKAPGRHAFAVRLPLASVPPGAYSLRVRARTGSGGDDAIVRAIPIRVRQ
jgi:hypothetical protein